MKATLTDLHRHTAKVVRPVIHAGEKVSVHEGRTVKRALSPERAAKATRAMFSNLAFVDLTGPQTIEALEESTKTGHIIKEDVLPSVAATHHACPVVASAKSDDK